MSAGLEVRQTAGHLVPVRELDKILALAKTLHPALRQWVISVAIVGDTQMRRLNRVYHGVDTTTDVLTFALADDGVVEIIICYDQARRQAKSAGWPIVREIQLLLAHGLLHGLGYRDQRPSDERVMRMAEATIMRSRRK